MTGPVELVPTTDAARWNDACRASGQPASPFHALHFLLLAAAMTRHRGRGLIVRRAGQDVGVLPWLTMRRGPFTVVNRMPFPYTGPLVPAELLPATLRAMRARARAERAVVQDHQFPPGTDFAPDAAAAAGYELSWDRTYVIDTTRSEDELWAALAKNVHRRIRKIRADGIEVRDSSGPGAAELVARIHEAIFARKGLDPGYGPGFPPPPEQLDRDGLQTRWAVAWRDGTPIGSLVTLLFEGRAGIWVGGSPPEHRGSAVNYLLSWDSINWARERGARTLDMVGLPDPGIEAFKSQFGGQADRYPVLRRFAPGWRGLQAASRRAASAAGSVSGAVAGRLRRGAAEPAGTGH